MPLGWSGRSLGGGEVWVDDISGTVAQRACLTRGAPPSELVFAGVSECRWARCQSRAALCCPTECCKETSMTYESQQSLDMPQAGKYYGVIWV